MGIRLMRLSKFTYKGQTRVAAEHGSDERGNGCLFTTQLYPVYGQRSFKVAGMMATTEVKGLKKLYWLIRWKLAL